MLALWAVRGTRVVTDTVFTATAALYIGATTALSWGLLRPALFASYVAQFVVLGVLATVRGVLAAARATQAPALWRTLLPVLLVLLLLAPFLLGYVDLRHYLQLAPSPLAKVSPSTPDAVASAMPDAKAMKEVAHQEAVAGTAMAPRARSSRACHPRPRGPPESVRRAPVAD